VWIDLPARAIGHGRRYFALLWQRAEFDCLQLRGPQVEAYLGSIAARLKRSAATGTPGFVLARRLAGGFLLLRPGPELTLPNGATLFDQPL